VFTVNHAGILRPEMVTVVNTATIHFGILRVIMIINESERERSNVTSAKIYSLLTDAWLFPSIAAFLWIRIVNSQLGRE
jgi:hypothetical protein